MQIFRVSSICLNKTKFFTDFGQDLEFQVEERARPEKNAKNIL